MNIKEKREILMKCIAAYASAVAKCPARDSARCIVARLDISRAVDDLVAATFFEAAEVVAEEIPRAHEAWQRAACDSFEEGAARGIMGISHRFSVELERRGKAALGLPSEESRESASDA